MKSANYPFPIGDGEGAIPLAELEAAAQAIWDCDNGIDGDHIATMIHENHRIEGRDLQETLGQARKVCRAAAYAALCAALDVRNRTEKPDRLVRIAKGEEQAPAT